MSEFSPYEAPASHAVGAESPVSPTAPAAEKRGTISKDGITIGWGAFVVAGAILGSAYFVWGLMKSGKDGEQ